MSWKHHLIASSFFVVLMVGAVILLQPSSNADATKGPDRFIQVVNATWGVNCMDQVEEMRRNNTPDDDGPVPESIRRNNVLLPLTKLCNNKDTCQFKINEDYLGKAPVRSCFKQLEIQYRCFLTDTLHTTNGEDNQAIAIDCRATAG